MITRAIESAVRSALSSGKAVILLGARQVGKTTLADSLFGSRPGTLWLNGDEPDVRAMFENVNSARLKAIIGDATVFVLDELCTEQHNSSYAGYIFMLSNVSNMCSINIFRYRYSA